MNVVHVFSAFPGRNQPYNRLFLQRLQRENIQTAVVSSVTPSSSDLALNIAVPVVYRHPAPGTKNHLINRVDQIRRLRLLREFHDYFEGLRQGKGLLAALRVFADTACYLQLRPDVVHVHHLQAINKDVFYLLSFYSIPWLVSLRGFDIAVRPLRDKRWLAGLQVVFEQATVIHAVSNDVKKRALELGAPESKVKVIRRSLEVDQVGRQQAAFAPPFQLISIGRLTWQKGHIYAVEAVAKLWKIGIPVNYLIAGDGPLADAISYRAWQLGIEDKIQLSGFVANEKLEEIMAQAHLIVHPSLTEAMPNALIHAQAFGLPAVATNVGGIPEVVRDGQTGYLVPPADADALAKGIQRLLESEADWQRYGQQARAYTLRCFEPSKEATEFAALYRSLSLS